MFKQRISLTLGRKASFGRFGLVFIGLLSGLLVWFGLSQLGLIGKVVQAGPITPTVVLSNSYFGGSGDDEITGLVHLSSGEFVVVGNSTNPAYRGTLYPGSGSTCSPNNLGGFVARFAADGRTAIWYRYFNCGIAVPNRVVVDSSDNLYIAGMAYNSLSNSVSSGCATLSDTSNPFVAKLAGSDGSLLWTTTRNGDSTDRASVQLGLASGNRPIVSGRNGSATIYLARFGANGGCDSSFSASINDPLNPGAATTIAELVVKPSDDTIYAVGYHQRPANLKVPFLLCLAGNGSVVWQDYNTTSVPASLGADSDGLAVSLDPNGNILAAFETKNGNTVLDRDPKNLSSAVIPQLNGAYQTSYGLGSDVESSFVGRYSAATGNIINATFFHALLVNGRTNPTNIYAVKVDSANRVYLVGKSAPGLEFTADAFRTAYADGEGFLTILNSSMNSLVYSSFFGSSTASMTGSKATDQFNVLSISKGKVALGGKTGGIDLQMVYPVQPTAGGGASDGMLTVIAPPYDLQLAWTSPLPTIGADQPSGALTVQLRDTISGALAFSPTAYDLTLTSSSPGGRFDTAPNGSFSSTSLLVTILPNNNEVSFYYKDSIAGFATLTVTPAAASGLNTLSSVIKVVKLSTEVNTLQFRANRLGLPPAAKPLTISLPGSVGNGPGWQLLGGVNYSGGSFGWLSLNVVTGPNTPQTISVFPKAVPVSATYPANFSATFTLQDTTYNSTTSVTVNYQIRDVKLSIVSSPQKISQNTPSGAITVELGDSTDSAPVKLASGSLTLNPNTTSGTGSFSGVVPIAAGSARASFTYLDTSVGTPTISVSAPGLTTPAPSQIITIVDGATACTPVQIPLTKVNNSGDGSPADPCQVTLRKALAAGNTITFATGLTTVVLTSPLPTLSGRTIQNGGCGSPKIRLDGWSAGAGADGLPLSSGNTIMGLAVYGFAGYGVRITGLNNTFSCTFIGTADGILAQPNGGAVKVGSGAKQSGLFNATSGNLIWQKPPD